ncbi:6195_t:CDS:1, partial [Dentiscutata erythropus]
SFWNRNRITGRNGLLDGYDDYGHNRRGARSKQYSVEGPVTSIKKEERKKTSVKPQDL